MVKNATRGLKIGVHLRFCPKFTVEFQYFDQKNISTGPLYRMYTAFEPAQEGKEIKTDALGSP